MDANKCEYLKVSPFACASSSSKHNKWYLDSGCLYHMTGNEALFSSLSKKYGGFVVFGDVKQGRIVGIGKVGKPPNLVIENVKLAEGLAHNLISVGQFYSIGLKLVFKRIR